MASTGIGYTYQDLIRKYADDIRAGWADSDLTPRQRRLTAVALATASNHGFATVLYPPSDSTRTDVIRAAMNRLWDGNAAALMEAIGPAARADYSVATERAMAILRNL